MNIRKVLIVEDEMLAAERLQGMLQRLDHNLEVVAILDTAEDTIAWLAGYRPDLIFMDIHLADGPCFRIFEESPIACPVVFTTAYDAYALKAFRLQALDYLLKPLKAEELAESLRRASSEGPAPSPDPLLLRQASEGEELPSFRERFLLRLGGNLKSLEVSDIALAYTESKTSFALTFSGKRLPLDFTLEQMEKQLDPDRFFRLNRQYLACRQAVRGMHILPKSKIRVETDPPAPSDIIVSSERSASFKHWMGGERES
jgi:DNA-binding LytR/AlgR family response regulator